MTVITEGNGYKVYHVKDIMDEKWMEITPSSETRWLDNKHIANWIRLARQHGAKVTVRKSYGTAY